jgi:hypothetical protein
VLNLGKTRLSLRERLHHEGIVLAPPSHPEAENHALSVGNLTDFTCKYRRYSSMLADSSVAYLTNPSVREHLLKELKEMTVAYPPKPTGRGK